MVAAWEAPGFAVVLTLPVLQLTTQLANKPINAQTVKCLNFCDRIIMVIFLRLTGVNKQ
jgi:predicted metal-binding protein